ncbi:uncharacterized protein LOC143295373 [Babylonia areolata]|uniref:uncharacterized protein LOC143295373 n=1 Tax=Babylonia areolata TaxID=304850 RepID=UPI003FD17C77
MPNTGMAFSAIDPNHDARLESMRRQSQTSYMLKRHDDLRKQCEKEMSLYDKAKRLVEAQCRRTQIQYLARLQMLRRCSSSSLPLYRRRPKTSVYDVRVTKATHNGVRITERSRSQTPRDDVRVTERRHIQTRDDVRVTERSRTQTPRDDVRATDERRHPHTRLDIRTITNRCQTQASLYDVTRDDVVREAGRRRGVRSAPTPTVKARSGGGSTSQFTGRERFLFRVLWRNGQEVYIRDESEARKSRELLNGTVCDDFHFVSTPRTHSSRP